MPLQEINQFDLILISDSGKPFVIKMEEKNGGHEPVKIEELDEEFDDVPLLLRDEGTTLAIMPDAPNPQSGCTCVLLNMQSIKASIKPVADPNHPAVVKARAALRKGGKITIEDDAGKKEEVKGTVTKKRKK